MKFLWLCVQGHEDRVKTAWLHSPARSRTFWPWEPPPRFTVASFSCAWTHNVSDMSHNVTQNFRNHDRHLSPSFSPFTTVFFFRSPSVPAPWPYVWSAWPCHPCFNSCAGGNPTYQWIMNEINETKKKTSGKTRNGEQNRSWNVFCFSRHHESKSFGTLWQDAASDPKGKNGKWLNEGGWLQWFKSKEVKRSVEFKDDKAEILRSLFCGMLGKHSESVTCTSCRSSSSSNSSKLEWLETTHHWLDRTPRKKHTKKRFVQLILLTPIRPTQQRILIIIHDYFIIFVQSTSDYFTDFCDFCVFVFAIFWRSSGGADFGALRPDWSSSGMMRRMQCWASQNEVNKINRSEVGSDRWNWWESPVIFCDSSSALKIVDSDVHLLRSSCHSGKIDSFGSLHAAPCIDVSLMYHWSTR